MARKLASSALGGLLNLVRGLRLSKLVLFEDGFLSGVVSLIVIGLGSLWLCGGYVVMVWVVILNMLVEALAVSILVVDVDYMV